MPTFRCQVKLYGFLNAEVEWVRALGGATPYTPCARVSDGNSRLGITGSCRSRPRAPRRPSQLERFLNNFEQGGIDDLGHPSTLESRNSFISIEDKRFGRLLVGYYDNAYRSLVGTGSNSGGNLSLTTDRPRSLEQHLGGGGRRLQQHLQPRRGPL